ncbi:hypothetical protein SDC9_112604 [bioreactor metagenome]|uniref:Uncharacterized protein n=1 Tax=bioreactor metagenome TaxID=1076179 RepID=A0A645BVB4_9ZZZZ
MEEAANGLNGNVRRNAGIRQTVPGMISSDTRPSLVVLPLSSCTIATEIFVTSDPVPQVVGTAMTGFAFLMLTFLK